MVNVLDKNGTPLMPCTPEKARLLVRKGRATVVSENPHTVMLMHSKARAVQPDALFLIDDGVREEFERLKSLHRRLGLYHGAGPGLPRRSPSAAGRPGAPSPALAEDAVGPAGPEAAVGPAGSEALAGPAGSEPLAVPAPCGAPPRGARWQDRVILSGIEQGSYVLDLGCGRGELLSRLTEELGVRGQGVEVDPEAAMTAMDAGVPVLNVDLSLVLGDFEDRSFDYVILESTLQTLQKPLDVIFEMLRVGRRGIVSFPNFGHWRVRLDLAARGRMPVTPELPYGWHDTPNIHLFTLDDMLDVCEASDIRVASAWGLCEGEIRPVGPQDNLVTEQAVLFLERLDAAGGSAPCGGRGPSCGDA
jgi:methionine biosynthesis protein MetW